MTDRPPRVPEEFDGLFRDSDPGATAQSNQDDLSPYEAFLRPDHEQAGQQQPQPVPQNRGSQPGHPPSATPYSGRGSTPTSPAQGPPPRSGRAATAAPAAAPPPVRLAQPKRKRPLWRRILRWVALLLAILMGYSVFLLVYLMANINKVDAMPPDQIRNTRGAVTLIVGSDARASAPGDVSRTDTIMLMVDPLFGAPTLLSIPRDSWVEIPGRGNGKINSAFAIGGPQLLIETIELNTGLRVDHYMEIGFEGIVWLTDAVGGLELCIDFDVNDPNSGLVMNAGCSVLEGQQALAFVRMRYSDPKGDLGRIQRQQQYIESLIATVLQPRVFLNPFTMINVMSAAGDALTVDQDTGVFNLTRFGWGMTQIGRGAGQLTTVPVADATAWRGGQSVVLWDDAAAQQLFDSLGAR